MDTCNRFCWLFFHISLYFSCSACSTANLSGSILLESVAIVDPEKYFGLSVSDVVIVVAVVISHSRQHLGLDKADHQGSEVGLDLGFGWHVRVRYERLSQMLPYL